MADEEQPTEPQSNVGEAQTPSGTGEAAPSSQTGESAGETAASTTGEGTTAAPSTTDANVVAQETGTSAVDGKLGNRNVRAFCTAPFGSHSVTLLSNFPSQPNHRHLSQRLR